MGADGEGGVKNDTWFPGLRNRMYESAICRDREKYRKIRFGGNNQ